MMSLVALSKLNNKTSELYSRYSNDPHMIPEYLRYLFKHPIETMHQLSEDALRCWVDTIEEARHIQDSLTRELKGSVCCLYQFLGKDPPASIASTTPTSADLTWPTTDQKDPAPDKKKRKCSKPRIKKRNQRAKISSSSCSFQTTLKRVGFTVGAGHVSLPPTPRRMWIPRRSILVEHGCLQPHEKIDWLNPLWMQHCLSIIDLSIT